MKIEPRRDEDMIEDLLSYINGHSDIYVTFIFPYFLSVMAFGL